jgi:hypothetical protein
MALLRRGGSTGVTRCSPCTLTAPPKPHCVRPGVRVQVCSRDGIRPAAGPALAHCGGVALDGCHCPRQLHLLRLCRAEAVQRTWHAPRQGLLTV